MQTEFKRVKHGEQPGDICRWAKIRMRESKARKGTNFYYSSWQHLNERLAKGFIQYLSEKSKTRQRRRDKEIINQEYIKYINKERE